MTTPTDIAAMAADTLARLVGTGGEFEIADEMVLGSQMPVFARRERRMVDLLEASSELDGDYLVTVDRRITFAEHGAAAASLAQELSETYGVARGDRVAILAANSPEWITAFWACTSLGAIAVAYNAWWTTAEISYALGHSTPTVVIADAKRIARLPIDNAVPVLSVETDLPAATKAHPAAKLADVEVSEDDPAVIIYTSGTTGRPKGATHSHRNVIATVGYHRLMNALVAALMGGASVPPARWLLSSPLFHIASLHNLAVPRLAAGETVVMTEGRFDPVKVLDLVARERVTNWSVVPTMAHRLAELGDLSSWDLSALRAFSLSSAPSSAALQARLRELIPVARNALVDSYGLTESCTGATVAPTALLGAHPGTVGAPIPTVSIQVRSGDNHPLPDGEEGEIWLRSPFNMVGYWNDPDATAEMFDDDRWMRTGDLGCVREGLLYLTTRRSDLILRGGENVYPVEIEQVLDEHPAVDECAVIGVDHADLGQEVCALVVLAPHATATEDELSAYVAQRLAHYKVPAHWRIGTDPLPRNATGKVVRAGLHL